jgi:cytochrome c556
MNRKWIALGASVSLALFVSAGLAWAADDEGSPLHKIMEKVQKENSSVIRGVRNAAMYKKSQEDVAKSGAELVKLGKESRPLGKETVEAQKKTIEEWNKLMDDYIKEAETFTALVQKKETTQVQAKDAYKAVSKSCSACHDVFRVDE